MAAASGFKVFWLTWFTKPAGDRLLYQVLRSRKPRKLLLLGLGDLTRVEHCLSLLARYRPVDELELIGVDRFESRDQGQSRLALKEAHRALRASGARIHLTPGDPLEALQRISNSTQNVELALVGADQEADSLEKAWFYLPRMLSPDAIVLRERSAAAGPALEPITRLDLARLAASATPRRRAAA